VHVSCVPSAKSPIRRFIPLDPRDGEALTLPGKAHGKFALILIPTSLCLLGKIAGRFIPLKPAGWRKVRIPRNGTREVSFNFNSEKIKELHGCLHKKQKDFVIPSAELLIKRECAPTRHKCLRTRAVAWSGRIYLGTSPRRTFRNFPCSKPPARPCAEE